MNMIDVMKRLAELDANNPNVVKENSKPIEECSGMMGGMGMSQPHSPASINMTAATGEELSAMLKDIMTLAGQNKDDDEEITAAPVSGVGALTVDVEPDMEPEMGPPEPDEPTMMRSMIDKLNPDMDSDEMDSDEMGDEEDDEEQVAEYDNSPDEQVAGYGAAVPSGDDMHREKSQYPAAQRGDNAMAVTYESLMKEYRKFVSEGIEEGYQEYDELRDRIDRILINAYHKYGTRDEILDVAKPMAQKVAQQLGLEKYFDEVWSNALASYDVDTDFGDNDDDFDYTDYSMRKGERGMEEGRYGRSYYDPNTFSGGYRAQGDMDREKSDFKRDELGWELRHEEPPSSNYSRSSRYSSSPASRGMYFYNVKPGQEDDARQAGLKQSKNGKWYSRSTNSQAEKVFGPGRYWEPKSEGVAEGDGEALEPWAKKELIKTFQRKWDGGSVEKAIQNTIDSLYAGQFLDSSQFDDAREFLYQLAGQEDSGEEPQGRDDYEDDSMGLGLDHDDSPERMGEEVVDPKYPNNEVKYRIVYRKSGAPADGIKSFSSKADAQQYAVKNPEYSVQAYRVKQNSTRNDESLDILKLAGLK